MSRVQTYLSRVENSEILSIREAEHFVELATALLASRWNAYGDALRNFHEPKSKVSKKAYEEAQRVHDAAHLAIGVARAKRCGRCKHWTKRANYFGCAAFKVLTNESRWMFTEDGPPWNDCRHFEPTLEVLG